MNNVSTPAEQVDEIEPVTVGDVRAIRRQMQDLSAVLEELRDALDASRTQLDESRELTREVRARMSARSA